MKNKFILLLLYCIAATSVLKAQYDPFDWQYAFGTTNYESNGAFCRTSDNNYFMATDTEETINQLYVAKVTLDGEKLWEKTLTIRDYTYETIHWTLCEGEPDYYYVGGGFLYNAQSHWKPYLIKLDNNGDTVWVKTYNGYPQSTASQIYNVIKGNDNSIIATGLFETNKIVKFNYDGDTVWTINQSVYKILALGDKYLAFVPGGLLLFIDEDGNIINQLPAPFLGTQDIAVTSTNDILILGLDSDSQRGFAKILENGEILFKKYYATNYSVIQFIKQTEDNKIICLGIFSDYFATADFRIWLFDESANYIKDTTLYRSGISETPSGLDIADDGDYILFGIGEQGPIGMADIILAKMNQWLITDIEEISEEIQVNIYPNPVKEILNIKLTETNENEYSIMDISGKILKQGEFVSQINVSDLKSGIYFINIINNTTNQIFNNKFIKI
jgi:hypothetical protein